MSREVGKSFRWPALAASDRAGAERDSRTAVRGESISFAPSCDFGFRNNELRQGPFGWRRRIFRQCQRAATIDHAFELIFSPAHIVQQNEACLTGKADAFGNSGEERRERGFPCARHDECGAVSLLPKPGSEREVLSE